jgi:hypothetical protein
VPIASPMRPTHTNAKEGANGGQRADHHHDAHAEHEEPSRTEPVAQSAHQGLSGGRGEIERRDHPGRLGDAQHERLLQVDERHRDHRGVQRIERGPQAEAGDREARSRAVRRGIRAAPMRATHRFRSGSVEPGTVVSGLDPGGNFVARLIFAGSRERFVAHHSLASTSRS